jgi:exosome complex component RRP40
MLSYTKYPLLSTIASLAPFETAVGLNGRVWIKTKSITEGIAIKRVIEDVNDGSLDGSDKQSVEKALKGYLA